jgi:acyl-CoA dehydrogenase
MSDSMIAESAARIFGENVDKGLLERFEKGQWPAALWKLALDNGLSMALASEASGGIGASWTDAYPIFRGLGYWQVPLPLAETMIAALLLSRAGLSVPEEPVALIDEIQSAGLSIKGEGSAARLSGVARRVPWARYCRWALVSLNGSLLMLDLSPSANLSLVQRNNAALEPEDEVSFSDAAVLANFANPLKALNEPLRTLGALGRSAMMVGAMEWLLEQSVQYAMDRVQFGKPIGRNQVIQQNLAWMAGEVSAARMSAHIAFDDAPDVSNEGGPQALFSAAVAKIRCGEAATRSASIAHQTHGAIGFTYEHALNFATRRLWAWREACGGDAWWAQKLGEAAIAAGSKGFWSSVTQRSFETLK